MYVPLTQLPDHARVWLYQAERDLTPAEQATAAAHLRAFCEVWAAHGHPLRASFGVEEGRFLLLAVDETAELPSGCSIDSSVRALRELEAKLQLGLLDKSRIAVRRPDGAIATFTRAELRPAVGNGSLRPDTLVYDTTAAHLRELRAGWVRPATQTWLSRYFLLEKNAR